MKKRPKTFMNNPENKAGKVLVQQQANQQPPGPGKFSLGFPVVGIGFSAGGLQALELFFRNLPPESGAAYVVISHLDPTKKGMLPEVLQSCTPMEVVEITDGLRLKPNKVYVMPSNRDVALMQGNLLLLERIKQSGIHLPIDHFFESLALDQRDKAICIILSGMGSDGTIGLKMIMENFGMVMVQAPETAEFDSMPVSAINTEFVDYILPPDAMPAQLLAYIKQPFLKKILKEPSLIKPAHALQKIYSLIRQQTGHDFSLYKRNTVYRRIERRMQSHQIMQFTQYVRYLQETPTEVELLFKELLIGVTKFFRDQEAFEHLQQVHLPELLARKPKDSVVRVWIAGCSTGEEAYSIAILFQECLAKMKSLPELKVQIFATDIDENAIDKARAGIYPENIESDVSPERLSRFFTKVETGYQIKKEIREMVVFAVHNITKDAPFTKLDLLCCRNLLIYLAPELQKKLMPVFHYSLNPNGLLFLGSSETINGFNDLFTILESKWKISQRSESIYPLPRITDFPFSHTTPDMIKNSLPATPKISYEQSLPGVVQKALLDQFAPPSVIINSKGEIFYINGRTGKYLEPASGKASLNLFEMAREGLKFDLSSTVYQADSQGETVVMEPVMVANEKGQQPIRLTVKPLQEPVSLKGLLLVVFEDLELLAPKKAPKGKAKETSQVAALEKELQFTRQRLQSTIEEMQSSLEELKSTNEELQSANEELQSTNEEAMTNKEEMQSLNEELMTINMQYQTKAEELSQRNNDMKNLLDSTEIATIFLDNDLRIKSFTPQATQLFNIIRSDVGRPISHISSNLNYSHLVPDVQEVLLKLVSKEMEIPAIDGEYWYMIRILPYRTADNFIDGAVITITDVTRFKRLELELLAARAYAENIINSVRDPLVVLDEQLRVVSVSKAFSETFHIIPEQTRGQLLYHLGNGQWDIPALREMMDRIFNEKTEFNDYLVEHNFPLIGHRKMLLNARLLNRLPHQQELVLLSIADITLK